VKIGLGSLVETNNGWYYFSIGYGLITINNESIYTLNPNAPLGQAMLGKVTGDNVIFQSKSIQILNVC
jgi:transcription elongation GreA/GreB family factor